MIDELGAASQLGLRTSWGVVLGCERQAPNRDEERASSAAAVIEFLQEPLHGKMKKELLISWMLRWTHTF